MFDFPGLSKSQGYGIMGKEHAPDHITRGQDGRELEQTTFWTLYNKGNISKKKPDESIVRQEVQLRVGAYIVGK
jgi:hypothetical protein